MGQRGRPRAHENDAAKMRAYRQRAKSSGVPVRRGTGGGGKSLSKFERAFFIGVDGEGQDYGPIEKHQTTDAEYTSRRHRFSLLNASDNSGSITRELYNGGLRLTTEDCLDFLCDLQADNKNAILVAFASGYDCNHMLMFGLSRLELLALAKGATVLWRGIWNSYEIEYRPRKSLRVARYPGSEGIRWKSTSTGGQIKHPNAVATLWDVWGFFQGSFVDVLGKWLGKDHADIQYITQMKAARSDFEHVKHEEVRHYNQLECRLLAQLMGKVAQAITKLDLSISRWDGAGAIAAAMNSKHDVKASLAACPPDVFEAARVAYSGGHIEAAQIGAHAGTIYHYDVNSAYPSEFIKLPDLNKGVWQHKKIGVEAPDNDGMIYQGSIEHTQWEMIPPPGFTLVRIRWIVETYEPAFCPLFYRTPKGTILYPRQGEGWYWYPEYEAARDYMNVIPADTGQDHLFMVLEWHHFAPSTNERPFNWIKDYYHKRQEWVQEQKAGLLTADTEWKHGAEKIIKLGLNSMYGKTAQQVGARMDYKTDELKLPTYFQLEWAGYVTSGCRAKLMQAAILNPAAVISFATDGLFLTAPISVDAPKEKTLGLWEYQHHDEGMCIVMPGVYWALDAGGEIHAYSRGFDKDTMQTPAAVMEAWRKNKRAMFISQHRLIGIGSAVIGDTFWQLRGRFVQSKRQLNLTGDSGKRYPIPHASIGLPHLKLCRTYPRDNIYSENFLSAKYKIAWIDDDGAREFDPDSVELSYEEEDAIQ